MIGKLLRDERGATMAEWGVSAGILGFMIAAAMIATDVTMNKIIAYLKGLI
jgi:Flp pilus assembly pilin Flp